MMGRKGREEVGRRNDERLEEETSAETETGLDRAKKEQLAPVAELP